MTPEGKLKKNVKAVLDALGAYYYMPVPTGYGTTTLDFLCCINGVFVAIETKAPGNKPTPLQVARMEEIRASGGIAIWTDNISTLVSCLMHNIDDLVFHHPLNMDLE